MKMNLAPIGAIHSPHQRADGTPIQAALAAGVKGMVEVFPEYAAGLRDLDGFERIWLVYWFDRAKPAELVVTPYLEGVSGVSEGDMKAAAANIHVREELTSRSRL